MKQETYMVAESQLDTIGIALDAVMISTHILQAIDEQRTVISPGAVASILKLAYCTIFETIDKIIAQKETEGTGPDEDHH